MEPQGGDCKPAIAPQGLSFTDSRAPTGLRLWLSANVPAGLRSGHLDALNANEFGLELRLAVLQEHGDDLSQIRDEVFHRLTL